MEIILLEDIATLGYKDDVVKVKSGYARNYLIPNKKAIIANASNKKSAEHRRQQQQQKYEKMMEELNKKAEQLKEKTIQIGAKTGTSGKIFGSITTLQISEALKKQADIEIDRRKIKMSEEIKQLGKYKAEIELHREVTAEIEFEVVSE